MSWWKRFVAIFKSEATDVKQGLTNVGQALDDELARKERELAATPEERIDMILEDQAAEDARFDQLTERVLGKSSEADAVAEVADEQRAPAEPAAPDDPTEPGA
ncbi:MAG: hypothetical protein KJP22_06485 [Acidimicrobiia bacterium]|nr:hypothetical protein [Acidimicrobiia bacterium]NNF87625.1 hypothetical protein [Acidimicrobiia bacterium]NNL12228.1 hypothetical protein [Acidimicrobiia bacterium]RZV43797.1 MAG: hypothetical protein EX267_07705 [Acidimicrobiia bacterium]